MKKLISKKKMSSWWIVQFFEKLWKKGENTEISNLQQPKQEGNLVSEPSYQTTKEYSKDLLAIKMILLNRLVYLGLSILEINKTVIHEFWHDYVKLYGEKSNYVRWIQTAI